MLTADELVPIVRGVVRPGIPVTAQHSQMLMKMLDKDGNGTITIDEYVSLFPSLSLLSLLSLPPPYASRMFTADELVPIMRGVVRPGIPITAQHSQMLG